MSELKKRIEEASDAPLPPPPSTNDYIATAPRISVQAFCETVETAAAIQGAGDDRRLGKAHLKIQMGGVAAAIMAGGAAMRRMRLTLRHTVGTRMHWPSSQ